MIKTVQVVSTQESLVLALETIKTVEIKNKLEFLGDEGEFCRVLKVAISGLDCDIVWYNNLSTIKSKHFEIPFTSIVLVKPTWPMVNKNELGLQLKNGDVTVAVI